ncbi:MAG: hypothetical protein JXA57_17840 [Armatimonadetes bacterium]|nr:hypothetical protein [Armatimonadota bacterium]
MSEKVHEDLEAVKELAKQFASDFNDHILPTFLSESAIAALRSLPERERREIVTAVVGYASESSNRGRVIVRAGSLKRSPKWLKSCAAQIAAELPQPVMSFTVRNEGG